MPVLYSSRLTLLGVRLTSDGIHPGPTKLVAIREFSKPQSTQIWKPSVFMSWSLFGYVIISRTDDSECALEITTPIMPYVWEACPEATCWDPSCSSFTSANWYSVHLRRSQTMSVRTISCLNARICLNLPSAGRCSLQ